MDLMLTCGLVGESRDCHMTVVFVTCIFFLF